MDDYNPLFDFDINKTNFILKHLGLDIESLPKKLIDDDRDIVRSKEEILRDNYFENSLNYNFRDINTNLKTVRFLKDFDLFNAGYDLETKNLSFKRTADIFRLMGVKNYYFMLQLNNPALIGIDARDPDLPDHYKPLIIKECCENLWYFLREVCVLSDGRKFQANRAVISFIWNYLNHNPTILILPRQQGKAQPINTLIRTTKGFKYLQDVNLEDYIITPNGKVSKIIGVYTLGKQRVIKFTLSDGRTTRSHPEHSWNVYENDSDNLVIKTTEEILHSKNRYSLPLVQPDLLNNVNLPKDPFEVGLRFMDMDAFDYLESSAFQRLELLKGILETYSIIKDNKIIIKTNNGLKAQQITSLVRSLSGLCKSEVLYEHTKYYILIIEHHSIDLLFKEGTEKYNMVKDFKYPDANHLRIVNILEEQEPEECICIELDDENKMYTCDDYVATHNTVGCQVILFWLTYIVGRRYDSSLITLKDQNRIQFVEAIKSIRTNCPNWLTNMTYKDKDTGTRITYEAWGLENKNSVTIEVPLIGEEANLKIGRGGTYMTQARDEPAYIKHIEEIVNSAGLSGLTAFRTARELGIPYGTFYITTPSSVNTRAGAYMYKMLMESTEWREAFFDSFNESHLRQRLIKACPKDTVMPYVGMVYNYLQLGLHKTWVKETQDLFNMTDTAAKIDLLLYWEEDGKDLLFDSNTREAINYSKKEILWSQEIGHTGLFIDWFISKDHHNDILNGISNTFYLIGCDTSGAIGKDACTIIIRDIRTGGVVGVGRYALAYLMDVGEVLKTLLYEIKNSLLIIERNYAAHMIDQLLLSLPALGIDPFKRIYNQIYQDPVKYSKEFDEIKARMGTRDEKFYLKFKDKFGFNTTKNTREELYGFLEEAVGMTGNNINYYKLIDELNSLRIKNNRVDHGSDGHDDLVIAWLLSYWFIKLGKNKTEYDIPVGIQLSDAEILKFEQDLKKEHLNPEEQYMINRYKERLDKLTKELMETDDLLMSSRLEHEIRKISEFVPVEIKRSLTIDEIITKANEDRKARALNAKRQAFGYNGLNRFY